MHPDKFNIRVYGLLISEEQVLVNEELFRGGIVTKFPGGGMDLGEGTHDCLKREWREELNIDIEIVEHFYTTDFFQQSASDTSQLVSIYYLVRTLPLPTQIINNVAEERTFWLPIKNINEATFTLPIDKIVGKMLLERL